jgi:LPXTG-motif cell wall-anchored protein
MTATIDLDPGPAGDPSDIVCKIPEDTYTGPTSDDRAVFVCPDDSGDPMTTDTGPNAILLMKMGASPETGSPLATIALAGAGLLAILGLGVFWRRRNVM